MRRTSLYPLFLTVLLSHIFGVMIAQNNSSTQLYIHTDQALYFTGDLLQYKLYLSPDFINHPTTIRVSLISNDHKCVDDGFIKTIGNTSISGQIEIPVDLSSGMYHLIFSGLNGINKQEVKIAQSSIPIYSDLSNDLPKDSSIVRESLEAFDVDFDVDFDLSIKLELDSIISKRAKAQGSIIVYDSLNNVVDVDVSIAVRKKFSLNNLYKSLQKSNLLLESETRFIANIIYLQGAISSDSKLKGIPVIGVYKPFENSFDYFKTDKNGKFTLPIEDFSGTKRMQLIGLNNENLNFTFNTPAKSLDSTSLIFNEEIMVLLEQSKKRKKINQMFDSKLATYALLQTDWTQKPINENASYNLDTYEKFPDLATMFTEINSPVKYRIEKNGEHLVRVFNGDQYRRGFYPEAPIFILDGMITKDVKFINELDIKQIEKVDIVSSHEMLKSKYGPIGQNGIVFVSTTYPQIVLPEAESDGFIALNGLKTLSEIQPNEFLSTPHHVPSFKSNLFWSTKPDSSKTGTYNFSFYQSDDVGEFEIEVFVKSDDGRIGYHIFYYDVNY